MLPKWNTNGVRLPVSAPWASRFASQKQICLFLTGPFHPQQRPSYPPPTYVDPPPQHGLVGALVADKVLHPVDVVQPEGHGGDQPLQRDVDGQPEVLLQQGAGQRPHRLRVLEVQAASNKQRMAAAPAPPSALLPLSPRSYLTLPERVVWTCCRNSGCLPAR